MSYAEVYQRSLSDPEGFWGEAAQGIDWDKPWDKVLDASAPPLYRWSRGGRLNTCYNAVDRHVANGRAEQAALIYDSPVTGNQRTLTFSQLRDEVALSQGHWSTMGSPGATGSSSTCRWSPRR